MMEPTELEAWPSRTEDLEITGFWIWDYDDEKSMLSAIVKYLRECWEELEGKSDREADLIVCGIGTSRFDLPVIAFRCNELDVETSAEVWSILFTTKQVDLSNVGISFPSQRDRSGCWVLYPKTANELCKEFGVKSSKPSGKKVWDMFEEGDYQGIKRRTEGEVRDIVSLYKRMRKRIFAGA